jgi:hypothetical protein
MGGFANFWTYKSLISLKRRQENPNKGLERLGKALKKIPKSKVLCAQRIAPPAAVS